MSMREVHLEVLNPTQRSPCVACPRELEPKDGCIANCERLRIYQIASAGVTDRTHTHELVGERTTPVKQAAETETFEEIEIGENHLLLDLTHHPAMRSQIGRIAAAAKMKNEDVAIWLMAAGLVVGFANGATHDPRLRGERRHP